MRPTTVLPALLALSLNPVHSSEAHHRGTGDGVGSLVSVSLEVEGRPAPLYSAPDGSGRFYAEAREGARYALRLVNRSHERLGVALVVDGLNAISGTRQEVSRPGRMYVLDPWEETTVRGWRTSLSEVRRFTFVDEGGSYAARSGKANRKMGWIEVAVYRERRPHVTRRWWDDLWGRDGARAREGAPAEAPEAVEGEERPYDEAAPKGEAGGRHVAPPSTLAPRSYPGTGWGSRSYDPATVVEFDPRPHPSETITLRYEYASALRALGILPWRGPHRDRLGERERAEDGFARPPRW